MQRRTQRIRTRRFAFATVTDDISIGRTSTCLFEKKNERKKRKESRRVRRGRAQEENRNKNKNKRERERERRIQEKNTEAYLVSLDDILSTVVAWMSDSLSGPINKTNTSSAIILDTVPREEADTDGRAAPSLTALA